MSIMAISGKEFELLYSIETTEDKAYFNIDLGKKCSEIVVAVNGRWTSDTTSAQVVMNLCNDSSFSQTGQDNRACELTFYNNNDRICISKLSSLGNGHYINITTAGIIENSSRLNLNGASMGGVFFLTTFPSFIQYIHIGSYNESTAKYKAGLLINIFGI